MSTVAAQSKPPPPTEDDLLDLYNQVWDGFIADSPTSPSDQHSQLSARDLDGEKRSFTESAMAFNANTRGTLSAAPVTTRSSLSQLAPGSAKAFSSRRLPPTPAASSPSTGAMPMSESRPYNHSVMTNTLPPPPPPPPARPVHSNSTSNLPNHAQHIGLPRRISAGSNGNPRRLPPTPDAAQLPYGSDGASLSNLGMRPATADGQRLFNLPSQPRLQNYPSSSARPGTSPSLSASSSTSTSSGNFSSRQSASRFASASFIKEDLSDTAATSLPSNASFSQEGRNFSSNGLERTNSNRPKGALAPSVPGLSSIYDEEDDLSSFPADMYASTPSSASTNYPRLPSPQQPYRHIDPVQRTYSPSLPSPPQNVTHRPPPRSSSRADLKAHMQTSSDDLRGVGLSSPALSSQDSYTAAGAAQLGRSTSNKSTTSSFQAGSPMPTPPSTSSTSVFPNGDTVVHGALGTAAMVDRGDSVSSYVSRGSAGSSGWPQDGLYDAHYQPAIVVSDSQDATGGRAGPGYAFAESSSHARASELERSIAVLKRPLELHEEEELDYDDEYEYEEDDENRFVNLALLSHIAVRLRDKVPRGTHVKGGIPYPRAFTGKDIVSTIQAQVQRELLLNLGISTTDRRPALQVARSLQSQLFFYEVEWGGRVLQDGVEDVYMFLDDQDGGTDARPEREELPTGVFTVLTKCYSPSCVEGSPCFSYSCPRRQKEGDLSRNISILTISETPKDTGRKNWTESIDPEILRSLPESEISRQTIIHKAISKEEMYVQDLDIIESLFMKPLRTANPQVIPPDEIDSFMEDVFGNILDLRECNRRLLEVMAVRQREQSPIIQKIGDVFLTAAAEFRLSYPIYVGNLPLAEKRLKDEIERNAEFRRWLEQCSRHPDSRRLDLKHFLTRPSEHLHKYPVLLDAILNETAEGNPDAEFLLEAIQAIHKLSTVAQLRTFQSAMGKGPTGKFEWHDLVPKDVRDTIPKQEAKRQSIIFELIKGEMAYVKDLESIETLYIRPLKASNPPIIPRDRLQSFLNDVFHNYAELHSHHRKLLDTLHEIQREEHPRIRSIAAPVLDAALNWRDAYMEYVPNYPIGWYRVDEEIANNAPFRAWHDSTLRHPDSHKYDMKTFIHRPIGRLLRYDLLLSNIMNESPPNHEDRESMPQVIEVLKGLGKESDAGTEAAKERVEIWRYNSNLVFKPGEAIDMDLLDENRSLVHTGKLWRQPDTGFEWSGWTELFALLFDNYLVLTKPKEKDGVTKYHVNRRPIPLDLLTLVNFTDPPQQRAKGILGGLRGGERGYTEQSATPGGSASLESSSDSRSLYPCTIHHNGRLGGLWTVYADSAQARADWKKKLDEAIVLRKVVTDANKVFEIETLSSDTFLVPSMHANTSNPSWNDENTFTGKVTCSVPFSTADGRGLVAIGCAEGVWIGLRHDPRSMRRVLHLKMVTQCAMLQDFGIFLVLADKALFAYHIEALVPSVPPSANATRTPQKLNGNKDVQFFSVGTLGGRTLIIYMKKKGLDSVFRVLEPVVGKIAEKAKAPGGFSRFGFGSQRSEWFRIFRDFFLPSESYDLIFLKAKIAILCSKGFEIMDLTDFKSVTIPQRDDQRLQSLAKRCESCKPIGMFRSNDEEFLLCYDEFGLYVNRHGDPSRTVGTIEWEGTAERVAWHPPYILLFDSRFIEVRHVETGRLAQIIPGNDVRCLWDGRGSSLPPVTTPGPDGWQDSTSQEARVHAVMKASETSGTGPRSTRAVAQHVFQLVPTIPLYLPGSLSSPSNSTYFPQTASPPHSPQLTPRHSWR